MFCQNYKGNAARIQSSNSTYVVDSHGGNLNQSNTFLFSTEIKTNFFVAVSWGFTFSGVVRWRWCVCFQWLCVCVVCACHALTSRCSCFSVSDASNVLSRDYLVSLQAGNVGANPRPQTGEVLHAYQPHTRTHTHTLSTVSAGRECGGEPHGSHR